MHTVLLSSRSLSHSLSFPRATFAALFANHLDACAQTMIRVPCSAVLHVLVGLPLRPSVSLFVPGDSAWISRARRFGPEFACGRPRAAGVRDIEGNGEVFCLSWLLSSPSPEQILHDQATYPLAGMYCAREWGTNFVMIPCSFVRKNV